MTIRLDDRMTRRITPEPNKKHGDDSAPKRPDVERPDGGNELIKRMKQIDPDRAKKYRQRSGQ